MTISFKCEHCGKKVEAPDNAGGRRGKCPYCRQSCYIPAPVTDEDLYDFASEDESAEQAAERQELRRQEDALISDMGEREPPAPIPPEQREDLKPEDLHPLVVNYCLDLAGSNLERAETHVTKLRKVRPAATAVVDDFLAGKALEPALDQIPARVLQGFLKQLRDQLR